MSAAPQDLSAPFAAPSRTAKDFRQGVCEGKIGTAPSGENGFGYDPIFYFEGKSFAQMTADEKDAVSHRGKALRGLRLRLKEQFSL